MSLSGSSLIAGTRSQARGRSFHAVDPTTARELDPAFHSASLAELGQALTAAADAAVSFGQSTGAVRAQLLRAIADEIETRREAIVERAGQETALPPARLQGETGRTVIQLRLFARLLEEGSWVDARIDRADPARQPLAKPDVRSMRRPLGPVAVFGASNFPLAFSVAGGDTASALAGGNPVVVKAHSAHPGTSELVGDAVAAALAETKLAGGVFSLLFDAGHELGQALVRHPLLAAVGFTGSRRGGRALMDLAAARPHPIPVFAEMGSVNPIFILPGALHERAREIADGLAASVNQGVGQFCTNPGVVVLMRGAQGDAFVDALRARMAETAPGTMLTPGICGAYRAGLRALVEHPAVEALLASPRGDSPDDSRVSPALLCTSAEAFLRDETLMEEVFGPSTLLVVCEDEAQMLQLAARIDGQLTATLHASDGEIELARALWTRLESRVGRLLWGGFPTGVEVCAAMVHGGPYPASSDGGGTSVGTAAIHRFTRRVAYQNAGETLLPAELRPGNPLGIWRLLDGEWTRRVG